MNRAKGGRKATDKPASPPKTICYCEGQRELGTLELFCAMCQKWFHHRCLKDMKELWVWNFGGEAKIQLQIDLKTQISDFEYFTLKNKASTFLLNMGNRNE